MIYFIFFLHLTSGSTFTVNNTATISYDSTVDNSTRNSYFDSVYSELATISCHNFTSCQVQYEHVFTKESKTLNVTEPDDEKNDEGYVIFTGRFPPLLPEACEAAAVSILSDECPGIVQLEKEQRPVMDLKWPRFQPSAVSLTEFKPNDEFEFSQTYNGEYFHIHKTSHLLINNVNYLIGGEKYYDVLDTTSYFDKEFNSGVWKIEYNHMVKTSISMSNEFKISRAASTVQRSDSDGDVGFICGSIFNPKECFVFDGETVQLNEAQMNEGHTDESIMINTDSLGLFIVGGGQNPFYINNIGEINSLDHDRHGIVETGTGEQWSNQTCASFPYPVVAGSMAELGSKIWLFGGHSGEPKDWVYYINTETCNEWIQHPKPLLSPRSGHTMIVNRAEHIIILVGNSLSSLNKPVEMWTFTPSWSNAENLIKQFNSTSASNNSANSLNVYYQPVIVEKRLYPSPTTFNKITADKELGLILRDDNNDNNELKDCTEKLIEHIRPRDNVAGKQRSITEAYETCKNKSCPRPIGQSLCVSQKIKVILSCVYCELDNTELKSFANAFCRVNLDEQNNCTNETVNSLQTKLEQNFVKNDSKTEELLSWTTVIESDVLSKEEVADTIVENFNKADEIVEEDVRLISNENLETITNEIKEGELEVEEDDSETTTVPLTTTATTEASKLSVHEILLISFSCFFEALFVAATIYFVIMGKKSSSLAAGAISVLIPILAVTGYYWLEGDITREVGIGLMTGSVLLTLLFIAIVALPKIQCNTNGVRRNQIEMTTPSSSGVSFRSPQVNPYSIN